MKQIVLSLALLPLLGVAGRAQVLYTNFGPGLTYLTATVTNAPGGTGCPTGPVALATQFQPSASAFFQDAKLPLTLRLGTDQVSVYLETDAGGMPGAIIEGPINVTGLSTDSAGSVITATSALHPLLLSGTSYWLVWVALNADTCISSHINSTGDFSGTSTYASDHTATSTGPWTPIVPGIRRPAFQIDGVFPDVYQVRYATNLTTLGDSLVNLSNTGATAISGGALNFSGGTICANVYVFDPNEEELDCCSCMITPNALQSMSVMQGLISNNLTPEHPSSVVIKLLATGAPGGTCDPTSAGSPANPLVPGLRAWGTTLHSTMSATPQTYGTETEFAQAGSTLSQGELNRLTNLCSVIISNGSGGGICKGCSMGGR